MIDPKEISSEEETQEHNDPEPIHDVSENLQQTINVHDAKNIIDNEL